ncbi:MAG TPA: hypothetical protein VE954_32295 [Oligoflexus sp.]|uniref:hypothetical protein n=1 Tax=Oligoflexus sp. TaxID=1971216 RepID=UPI002D304DDB|nr:hypothetical protein [Oligoflexus sp.]HYX37808.1 hypothetical protein [Oligoflexus sp.]
MKLRHIFHALALASLFPAAQGFSRGGETGTLDELEAATRTIAEIKRNPGKSWSPHYLSQDHFRRLRSRLSVQTMAPIPGWDERRAWRLQNRYFTEDNVYEILPLVNEPIR